MDEVERRGFALPEGGVLAALGIVNLYDLAAQALFVLPQELRAYAADGGRDEITYGRARSFLDSIGIIPRYLVGVEEVDTRASVLGQELSTPVLPAPSFRQASFHPAADAESCAGAVAAGSIGVVGAAADVREPSGGPHWCELVMHEDRERVASRAGRAEELGYRALVWTTDYPIVPDEFVASVDGTATFAEIEWLASVTSLPVVVRGILRPDDARACVDRGAAAVVVSNHSARAVDGALSAPEALAAVVDEVGGDAQVYLEGGVRRGVDVLRALALGADAVFVGRPVLWGLAAAGRDGVRRVFDILTEELIWAMKMAGTRTLATIDRELLVQVPTMFETQSVTAQAEYDRHRRPGSVVSRHYSRSSRWRQSR